RCDRDADETPRAYVEPVARPGRRGLGRHLRRRAGARPGLRGGLGSRDRYECRHEQWRRLYRAAGHGRRTRISAQRAGCAAQPGGAGRRPTPRASAPGTCRLTPAAMRVVLATGNPGKLRELQSLLAGRRIDLVTQAELGIDPAAETGLTFVENAILKARHA